VPTLLDLADVEPAPRSRPLDGQSFAPVLQDPLAPGKPFAFGEYALNSGRPFYMRRDDRWKYVWYTAGQLPDAAGPSEELYDPDADPGELHNLATDPAHADVLAEQRRLLLNFLRQQGAPTEPTAPRPASQ